MSQIRNHAPNLSTRAGAPLWALVETLRAKSPQTGIVRTALRCTRSVLPSEGRPRQLAPEGAGELQPQEHETFIRTNAPDQDRLFIDPGARAGPTGEIDPTGWILLKRNRGVGHEGLRQHGRLTRVEGEAVMALPLPHSGERGFHPFWGKGMTMMVLL